MTFALNSVKSWTVIYLNLRSHFYNLHFYAYMKEP